MARSVDAAVCYRGALLMRNITRLGPYSRTMPRTLWWPKGVGAVSYVRGTLVAPAAAASAIPEATTLNSSRHPWDKPD